MTTPSSTSECPAMPWPPPRTATGRPLSRAQRRAAATSLAPWQRARSAGSAVDLAVPDAALDVVRRVVGRDELADEVAGQRLGGGDVEHGHVVLPDIGVVGGAARPEWVRRREAREYRSCTGTEPIAVLPSEDGNHVRSVLPGGNGLGGAHREVDTARRPRAPVRQHALQRPPPRGPAHVTRPAVQAPEDPRTRRRGRPRRRGVPPHPGRQGAVAGDRVDGHLGPALGARRRHRQALRRLAADVGHPPQRRHGRPARTSGGRALPPPGVERQEEPLLAGAGVADRRPVPDRSGARRRRGGRRARRRR